MYIDMYNNFFFSSASNGNVGILPLQTTGRIGQSLPSLSAHSGMNSLGFLYCVILYFWTFCSL